MHRSLAAGTLIVLVAMLVTTGCGPDPKERIAQLDLENQQLMDDLAGARGDAQQARSDQDLCELELATLRADNDNLRTQLTDARANPPATDTPEGWTAVPGGAMIALPGEVLFRAGKVDLRPEARRALDDVVRVLRSEYADRDVLVYGHTDGDPIKKSGWKDNLELSAQRALAVVRHLHGRGIAPARLVAGGCGEHRPVSANASSAGKAKNRRVEIYVLDAVVQTASR